MRRSNQNGLTLVELLVTIAIVGIIAGAAIPLLSASLDANNQGASRSRLYHEGLLAMERMTSGVKQCTFLLIPNDHTISRDILAFSGYVNNDNDFYFNDSLFPRIDEDPKKQMTDDGVGGIAGFDDDGDGLTDEGDKNDDDEDDAVDEDPLDGTDNDGDGNIDEDTGDDANRAGMDDDADGAVDEGDSKDDDEDGDVNEDSLDPLIYSWNPATNTLTESMPYTGDSAVLSSHVTFFEARYQSPTNVRIRLTLEGDNGESIAFDEHVCPRNVLQKTGKRVR